MKKVFCVLLAALTLLSVAAVPALAAGEYAGKTVILYTGNLRGDVDAYAGIAAAKADYAARGADVILVDAGNYLRGSAAANSDFGLSIYKLMDAAGYDVAAMGPAEFSCGSATTGYPYHGNFTRYYTQKQLQEGTEAVEYSQDRAGAHKAVLPAKDPARFRTVASNVAADGTLYSFEESVTIETRGGVKIVFYCVTDPAAQAWTQDGLVSVSESVPEIAAPDADLVVRLTTAPGTGTDGAGAVIDASSGETLTGAYVLDNATGEVRAESVTLSGSDAAVAALAEEARANAARTVGSSEVTLNGSDRANWNGETNLGDFVTDALIWYAKNYIDGYDKSLPLVAIQNGGNCDYFLYEGDVTETDLLRALPFSPMGVGVLELTGAQLLETLEAADQTENCPGFAQVSGLSYALDLSEDYDGGAAYGNYYRADSVNRVTITDVGGAPFDPEATYALVADNYILNGNDTYYTLKEARDGGAKYVNNGGGVRTRDIAAQYIEKALGGVIGESYAAPQGRITVTDIFRDVPLDAYFADAVAWAYEKGITKGAGDGTVFLPGNTVTRGEAVTFLWRASGKPEPKSSDNPFTDVSKGAYYYKAVLWAVEQGITKGTGDGTTFSPGENVKREQMITFQWRAAGKPGAAGTTAHYYDGAVAWAEENGLLAGTAEAFRVGADCPRADVVTYLYRAMA